MDNIVKICKVHGGLSINQVRVRVEKRKDGSPAYRCKACERDRSIGFMRKHGIKSKGQYNKVFINSITNQERIHKYKMYQKDYITDAYLVDLLNGTVGLKTKDVTPKILEMKREAVVLKRMALQIEQEIKNMVNKNDSKSM